MVPRHETGRAKTVYPVADRQILRRCIFPSPESRARQSVEVPPNARGLTPILFCFGRLEAKRDGAPRAKAFRREPASAPFVRSAPKANALRAWRSRRRHRSFGFAHRPFAS